MKNWVSIEHDEDDEKEEVKKNGDYFKEGRIRFMGIEESGAHRGLISGEGLGLSW